MKIYAFYTDLGDSGAKELIPFWKERWKREGWEPIVLDNSVAMKHPRYSEMIRKTDSLKTPPCCRGMYAGYFRKWLAFASINGWVSEYDVFPIKPFPPREPNGFTCLYRDGGPGLICGTRKNFDALVSLFLTYRFRNEDGFDLDDQHIMELHRDNLYDQILDEIRYYGYDGWREKALCHFSGGHLEAVAGGSKCERIRKILSETYP